MSMHSVKTVKYVCNVHCTVNKTQNVWKENMIFVLNVPQVPKAFRNPDCEEISCMQCWAQ